MKGEILSLKTSEKLARYEMIINYIKNYIKVEPDNSTTIPIKIEFKEILKMFEGKDELI